MKRNLQTGMIAIPLIVALLLQAGCTPLSAQKQVDNDQPQRTISISGSGEASAQPDMATLELGVQTEAKEASMAMSQNNERMQTVIKALKKAGVAAEDIQTQIVQIRPRYEEVRPEEPTAILRKGTRELVGYTATNIVEVRIRDLDALGELLDTAVQAGSNRVQGIRFEVSDPTGLLDLAREAAWNDARHKAEQLVDLADAELGRVLTINESSRRPLPIVRESVTAKAAAVPIEAGTQTIEVNVQVTWLLR